MPSTNDPNSTAPRDNSVFVDWDALLSRQPFIHSVDQFLMEYNRIDALEYWLTHHCHTQGIQATEDIRLRIFDSIAEIDHRINDQLNAILHHEKFQALEAGWRGLWNLCVQADGHRNIKIKVLNITWSEVVKDIDRALEFDQSQLFKKIYSDEYGMPGGEPYGVLIGNYEISHRPSARHPHDDITTLQGMAEIAAASFAPFIAGVSHEFFGLTDFSTLGQPLNLDSIFSQQEYIRWHSLRRRADARFIGLTLPRILMRKPYRKTAGSDKGLFFFEQSDGDPNNYLWGNAAFAFASVLIREFASVGWFGHIRGVPRNQVGGGLMTNLVTDDFRTDDNALIQKPCTDVIVTDSLERDLSALGFVPLCQCYDTPFAAFYSNQSIQSSPKQASKDADTNAKLAAMLQHVLCGSRVAHYIKVIIRDKIGSFITATECEDYLRNWLFKYSTGRDDLEWEEQARYPLRDSAVSVKEHPSKPGQYMCVIHLVPHYQLDQMVSELELVTELAQGE